MFYVEAFDNILGLATFYIYIYMSINDFSTLECIDDNSNNMNSINSKEYVSDMV